MSKKLEIRLDSAIFINAMISQKAIHELGKQMSPNTYWPDVNYVTSDTQLKKIASCESTLQDALSYCDKRLKSPKNAACNKDTINIGANHIMLVQPDHTFEIDPRPWHLRKDVSLKCKFPFGYVKDGEAFLFVPQYRKGSFVLDEDGLLMQASVLHHVFAKEDYENVLIETIDMSFCKSKGERKMQVRRYTAEDLIPEDILLSRFDNLLETWDAYVTMTSSADAGKGIFR